MVDTVRESGVWGVNDRGEILVQSGSGKNVVEGYIPANSIPSDTGSNHTVFKFPKDIITDQYLPGRSLAKMDGTDGTLSLVSTGTGEAFALDTTTYSIPMVKCTLSTTAAAVYQADYTLTTPTYIGGFSSMQIAMAFGDMSATEISGSNVQLWIYTQSNLYSVRPQLSLTYQEPNRVFTMSFGRDCNITTSADSVNRWDEDVITRIRVVVTAGSSSAAKAPIWIGPITVNNRRKKGSVLIWLDGDYISQNKYILPMLDNYGLKANLAIVPRGVVAGGGATVLTMNEDMLRAWYAKGHIPVVHTVGQATNGWDNTTDYPAVNGDNGFQSVYNELIAGDAYLDVMGRPEGKGHRINGYTNAFDPAIPNARQVAISNAFTAAGTKTCRVGGTYNAFGGTNGVGMLHSVANPHSNWRRMMGTLQLTNTHTAFEAMAQIDAAAQRGEVAGILLHRSVINSATPAALEMTNANTQIWLEYLAARVDSGNVLNETIDQLWNRLERTDNVT